MTKDLKYYMALPYTSILKRDEEGDYIAKVAEFDGCTAHGSTPQEALASLEEMKALWIEDCLESGDPIREPEEDDLPSGKWVQRVPRRVHRALIECAKRDNVSLNHWVSSALCDAVGMRKASSAQTIMIAVERSAWRRHHYADLAGADLWNIDQKPWRKHMLLADTLQIINRMLPEGSIYANLEEEDEEERRTTKK